MMKSSQNGHLSHQSTVIITDPDGLLQGRPAGKAGHPGISGQRLGGTVIGWPVLLGIEAPLAESVLFNINNAGIDCLDLLIVNIPAPGDTRSEIELDDIRLGDQFHKDLLGDIDMQVQGHVIFIGIDVHEHGRLFLIKPSKGIQGTGHVSRRG